MLSLPRLVPRAALSVLWTFAVATPAIAVMPTRTGIIPPEVAQAFDARVFELPERSDRLGTSAVQTVWNIPVILVGFSDQPLSPTLYGGLTPAQHFDRTLFDTTGVTATGSVFDYYRWVSGQRIRVVGKVVATVTLTAPKNYYANNNWGLGFQAPRNMYGFVSNTLQFADTSVDWRPFDKDGDGFVDMVWVVHSGFPGEATLARDNLWSVTSRLTSWPSGESFETRTPRPGAPSIRMRIDRFAVLPELSAIRPGALTEIGVYCHEFGHALGLPDLYDTSTLGGGLNSGTGNWSLMGTGSYGTDGLSPEFPAHLGAWPLRWLGWRESVRPTHDSLIVQAPLAEGAPIVEFWFQGESNPEYFLIENRQRLSFDRNLPSEGLIVYQIDETVMTPVAVAANRVNAGLSPGLRLVEADGLGDIPIGRNRGDSHDPFPGFFQRTMFDDFTTPSTRTFRGAVTNIGLREIEPAGDDMRYRLQVRSPGWEPPVNTIAGEFSPIWPSGPANRAVFTADGSTLTALSERRGGRPQIVLRSRPRFGDWEAPVQLSESPVAATDPAIAILPGGSDLVLTWSDSRHGSGELYFRSRIGGVWSPERRLTELAGDSRYPSVGVDRFGRVHLAWLYTEGSLPQVRFMTFTYFSPFGMPLAVTAPARLPDAPVIAVSPDGTSHIFWPDRATSPSSVWFARYTPTGGLASPQPIHGSSFAQPAIDAVADATGAVHVVWQVTASGGVNQFRYQRRPPSGASPFPPDTVVVSRSEGVQNPVLRLGPGGLLHLAFITFNGGVPQVRYKRRHPDFGWDHGSTEVSFPSEGAAARPQVVPATDDEVSVLYFLPVNGGDGQMERRRFVMSGLLASPDPVRAPLPAGVRLGPNPLRAGAPLRLRPGGERPTGDAIDVYDIAGRRVATTAPVSGSDDPWVEIPGSVTRAWESGVYFARARGSVAAATRLVVLR